MDEKKNIGRLFDRIAGSYDLLNHLLSFNIDRLWRKKAAAAALDGIEGGRCLDVAVGTGDLAIELARLWGRRHADFSITGIDLSPEMMRLGKRKTEKAGLQDSIDFIQGSALEMPFADNVFDVVTCAYGVRNFSDTECGLREMQRVMKPGGRLMVLEFSYPDNRLAAGAYDLYFSHILPWAGRLVSRDKTAYTYLNRSVKNFVWGVGMCSMLGKAGFRNAEYRPLTLGITTIYTATK
jgi:demethylmenaquinone methyltransferase/2-methoxy-6-polyprenyl-1,4-benzoquinol methylase